MKDIIWLLDKIADYEIRIWEHLSDSVEKIWETMKEVVLGFVLVVIVLLSPIWVGPYLIVRARMKNVRQ